MEHMHFYSASTEKWIKKKFICKTKKPLEIENILTILNIE